MLVDELRRIVGMGYNGFPRGVADDDRLYDRATKYEIVVHAEVNAIVQAGESARGSTLYVYPSFQMPPICSRCAGVVIQAGVAGIVGFLPDADDERANRWSDSIKIAGDMWDEAGLPYRSYEEVDCAVH